MSLLGTSIIFTSLKDKAERLKASKCVPRYSLSMNSKHKCLKEKAQKVKWLFIQSLQTLDCIHKQSR